MSNEVIKHSLVTELAATYEQAVIDIKKMHDDYVDVNKRLSATFGNRATLHLDIGYKLEKAVKELKESAWRHILEMSQVRNFMSLKSHKELEKQINEGDLPEITANNINETLSGFMGNISTLLDETVREVFDWLIPWREDYLTNKKYQVGKKVIKDYMVTDWNGLNVNYSQEDQLTAFDNAFHLLDGQGVRRYPDNLVCGIKSAMKAKEQFYEDEMFKIKWYKKGTMHIDLKRLDLLKELNRIGAGFKNTVGDRERPRGGFNAGIVPFVNNK